MDGRLIATRQGAVATGLLVTFALAVSVTAGVAPPPSVTLGVLALLVGGSLVIAGVTPRRHALLIVGLMIAVALGLLRGSAAARDVGAQSIAGHIGRSPIVLIGRVREGVAPGRQRQLVVDAEGLATGDTETALSGALLVSPAPGAAVPAPGDLVRVEASGLRSAGRRPGGRSAEALERRGVDAIAISARVATVDAGSPGIFRALAWVRERLTTGMDSVLPEPTATLLLGVAFGLRRPLAAEVTAPLQDSGLFHIVVVSGLKIVIVAGMVRAVAGARGWPRRRYGVLALTAVGSYVLISGAGPAAVRSAVMAALALGLSRGGRRTDPIPILALVAAVMLALDPLLWSDVGFQLSFLGTAGILLLADRLARRLPGPRLLKEPFAVTVAAQLATFPIMAGTFGVISVAGPVANAVVLPTLPALIVVGGLGATAGGLLPVLGWLPLQLAGAGIDGIMMVASVASALPGAAIHVGEWPRAWSVAEIAGLIAVAVVLAPVVAARWRRREAEAGSPLDPPGAEPRSHQAGAAAAAVASGVLAAAVVMWVGDRPDGRIHVSVLDVGAAPAVLVKTGEGGLALVDGGADPQRLLTALGRVLPPTVHSIDLVVMTGGDRTTAAGLAGLTGRYRVGRVMTPGRLAAGAGTLVDSLRQSGAGVETLDTRTRIWSGAGWRCLPMAERPSGSACMLAVTSSDGRALLLGDATPLEQEESAALVGPADLLVASPNGSLAPSILDQVKPAWVAVPTAAASRSPVAEPAVRSARTGVDGDLDFDGTEGGLRRRDRGG